MISKLFTQSPRDSLKCSNRVQPMFKRLFDIFISFFGLILLSPLLVLLSALIRKEDNGPVFFRGLRVGKDKKTFRMYKFRTMVMDAENIGGPSTSRNDSRITNVGKILRRYKLDEIPQLLNVLKGEMSLVGPRPEVVSEAKTYDPQWDVIFSVRPGITDLASIEFRNEGEIIANSGIEDAHEAYRRLIKPKKLKLQREYVENRSWFLDIKILSKTVMALAIG